LYSLGTECLLEGPLQLAAAADGCTRVDATALTNGSLEEILRSGRPTVVRGLIDHWKQGMTVVTLDMVRERMVCLAPRNSTLHPGALSLGRLQVGGGMQVSQRLVKNAGPGVRVNADQEWVIR
jgi:hypothetical protein